MKQHKHKFLKIVLYAVMTVLFIALTTVFVFLSYLELNLPSVSILKDVHLQEPLRIFTRDGELISEFGNIRRIPVSFQAVPASLANATVATEDRRFYDHVGVDFIGLARAVVVLFTTGKKEQGGSTITMQVARNFFLTRKKTYLRKIREILLALKIDHELPKEKILELYFNKIFYGQRAYGVAAAAKIYYGEKLSELTLAQAAMLAGLPQAPSRLNPITNPRLAKIRRNHVLARMRELKYITEAEYQTAIDAPVTAAYHDLKPTVFAPYVAEMARQWTLQRFGKKTYQQGYDVYTTIDSHLQVAANNTLVDGLLAYDRRHGYRGPEGKLNDGGVDDLPAVMSRLQSIRVINGLMPALVVGVGDQSVNVLLASGETVTIEWAGLKWARWQIKKASKVALGPPLKTASQILKPGYLIRVKKIKSGLYRLAQIPEVQGALVALDPSNGALLALNGGFDYFLSNFNHVTQAERQAGSSFKPFFYSAALAKGFTLASLINDAPIAIPNSGGDTSWWRPLNDTKKFYGPTSLRTALTHSRNVVSVRLMQQLGIQYAIDYATRFGFKRSQMPSGLSLALGAAEATPLQMVSAYAVFANGGRQVKPYLIDRVIDDNRHEIYQAPSFNQCEEGGDVSADKGECLQQVITPQNSYLMTSALQDVIRYGTGRYALKLKRRDLAGKTGTTNDQKDGWFNGFNPKIAATVWVGYDEPQSLGEYASRSALPIWTNFISTALKNQPESRYPEPSGIITVRVDPDTGLLASANDPNARFELFREQYAPTSAESATDDPSKKIVGLEQLY